MQIGFVCINEPEVSNAYGWGMDWTVWPAIESMQTGDCKDYGFNSGNGKVNSILPATDVNKKVIDELLGLHLSLFMNFRIIDSFANLIIADSVSWNQVGLIRGDPKPKLLGIGDIQKGGFRGFFYWALIIPYY